jgi:hypothetical protein
MLPLSCACICPVNVHRPATAADLQTAELIAAMLPPHLEWLLFIP